MQSFNILHLTDLHYGLKVQDSLLPSVRESFKRDLLAIESTGPWDLVIFTGDLVQSGTEEQYQKLNAFLKDLWQIFADRNCRPALVSIPGNHDLSRPAPTPAALKLRHLADDHIDGPMIWDALFSRDPHYRPVIDAAFANYMSWLGGPLPTSLRTDQALAFHAGELPGDFSAIFDKNGWKLGVVGLNSAFLQLTGEDFAGKLALHPLQFQSACGGDAEAWLDTVDTAILLTHHPPSWLTTTNREEVFYGLIHSDRFAAHFCGHLHIGHGDSRGKGWSSPRRIVLGGSLFGFEADPIGTVTRLHGYSAIRLNLDTNGGQIKVWPRRAQPAPNYNWSFRPDYDGFALSGVDQGTEPVAFPLARRHPPPLGEGSPAPTLILPQSSAAPRRREITPCPVLDPAALFRRHFVGRSAELNDFNAALDGFLARQEAAGRRPETQLFWLHGLGGMGKSWFLRQAATEVGARAKVALIDWYLPEWHHPSQRPPGRPLEALDAIAHRLAQIYTIEDLEPYWSAHDQVEAAAKRVRDLYEGLQSALSYIQAYGPAWRNNHEEIPLLRSRIEPGENPCVSDISMVERLMKEAGLWSDDPTLLRQGLDKLVSTLVDYDQVEPTVFNSWLAHFGQGDGPEVQHPSRLLSERLRSCMRSLSDRCPLVLLFDTCELLPDPIEDWLRRTLIGLLDGSSAVLVMIASRMRPDARLPLGSRAGWRNEVEPVRFRIVPFGEELRFSLSELDALLKTVVAPELATPGLAAQMHRVTLGVPFATGILLNMHRDGDQVLYHLDALEQGAAEEGSVNRALEIVTRARQRLHT
jgi:hypothetical protein